MNGMPYFRQLHYMGHRRGSRDVSGQCIPCQPDRRNGDTAGSGAVAKNLTESQFGIASVKHRWNLSGTFQQCLPRYISAEQDGSHEREFLNDYFDTPGQLLTAIFLKGYQWPFDPRKVEEQGSSLIDLLVYQETVLKGRQVFLDFMHNPSPMMEGGNISFRYLTGEAREYLENSRALLDTPYKRLKHMNPSAIEVYGSHHIDLSVEYLEIAVCAQHNNGGIGGNQWWESNIRHLFTVGEVNGSHGIYRPGGSALNAGQVGAIRASQYIAKRYVGEPCGKGTVLRYPCERGGRGDCPLENASCMVLKAVSRMWLPSEGYWESG